MPPLQGFRDRSRITDIASYDLGLRLQSSLTPAPIKEEELDSFFRRQPGAGRRDVAGTADKQGFHLHLRRSPRGSSLEHA